jgi:hypothetical protein
MTENERADALHEASASNPNFVAASLEKMNHKIAAAKEKKEAVQKQERESEAARKEVLWAKLQDMGPKGKGGLKREGEGVGKRDKDGTGEAKGDSEEKRGEVDKREKIIADLIEEREKEL